MTNSPVSPSKKSGLMLRVISALVMLPVAISIILLGGVPYIIFVGLLTVMILYEWNGITEKKSFNGAFVLQTILSLILVYSMFYRHYFDFIVYLVPVALLGGICFYQKMKFHFALLGAVYALLPALSLIWLRTFSEQGAWIVLWTMIIVWSMDTGAYFAGKNIGGPKMAPSISPNKTWAGLIGGALTAVIMGTIAAYYFDLNAIFSTMNPAWRSEFFIPLTAFLAIWSQMGDLAESALKRHFNVKDSGTIIPGHGGVMDRVDAIVFAAPAVALFLYV
ncbi:MAG: phosphatidate cytidylyltransferase [Emcibacter sp.]|nr:phosphatidate cytidylyltransferase [Emcibacter sp.]